MGSTTPRFGIRYPYQAEVVTPQHFANFASDMNAALTSLATLRDRATNMPAAHVTSEAGTTVPANTTVTLALNTSPFVVVNNAGMWNPAQNDRLTCTVAGIYVVSGSVGGSTTNATTMNAFELSLTFTGANNKVILHKENTENNTHEGHWAVNTLWIMQPGDYVRMGCWWSGSGSITPAIKHLSAVCVALI